MVSALTNVGAFAGGIIAASAIFALVWLFATWWHSRKRDRALLASQAEVVQSLDDGDAAESAEPTLLYDTHIRKRMRVLSDRSDLVNRFRDAQVTIILDGDSILMVDVDVKEAKRPKAAWEQEQDDTGKPLSGWSTGRKPNTADSH